MDRCGGANIKIGDKYSVRFTDRVHWFLEIQSRKKNGDPCLFTIGLGLLEDEEAPKIFKEVPGPDMFKGYAFIISPDKVELECHRRLFNDPNAPQPGKSPFDLPFDHRCRNLKYLPKYPKKMLEYYSKNNPGFFDKKKVYLRGKAVRSFKSWVDPSARQYSGRINATHLKIIQHFVANKRYKSFLGLSYKRIILPSPYFLLSQYDPVAAIVAYQVYKKYFANTVPAAVIVPSEDLPTTPVHDVPIPVPDIPGADAVAVDTGDVVETTEGESFTVIQGGGIPRGGLGGIYRPAEGFQSSVPRAFGALLQDRTTNVAFDLEGSDPLQ